MEGNTADFGHHFIIMQSLFCIDWFRCCDSLARWFRWHCEGLLLGRQITKYRCRRRIFWHQRRLSRLRWRVVKSEFHKETWHWRLNTGKSPCKVDDLGCRCEWIILVVMYQSLKWCLMLWIIGRDCRLVCVPPWKIVLLRLFLKAEFSYIKLIVICCKRLQKLLSVQTCSLQHLRNDPLNS